jgi:hypothetical protein
VLSKPIIIKRGSIEYAIIVPDHYSTQSVPSCPITITIFPRGITLTNVILILPLEPHLQIVIPQNSVVELLQQLHALVRLQLIDILRKPAMANRIDVLPPGRRDVTDVRYSCKLRSISYLTNSEVS